MHCISNKGDMVAVNEKPPSGITDRQWAAIASLSPRERDCLRLAGQGYHQTKEIALSLDISEDRVNKLIQNARKKLGGVSRGEAVRQFIEWESFQTIAQSPTQFMASPSLGLQETGVLELSDPVDESAAAPDPAGDVLVTPPQIQAGHGLRSSLLDLVPLRRGGRQANDLTIAHTMIAIAFLAVGALVAVGSAVSLLTGVDSLYHHY